jgi:hypothetical protein
LLTNSEKNNYGFLITKTKQMKRSGAVDQKIDQKIAETRDAVRHAAAQKRYWRARIQLSEFCDWLARRTFETYLCHCDSSDIVSTVTSAAQLRVTIIERRGMAAAVDPLYLPFITSYPSLAASLFLAHSLDIDDYSVACAQRIAASGAENYSDENSFKHCLHATCDAVVDDWLGGSESSHIPHFAVQAMWLNCLGNESRIGGGQLRSMLHTIINEFS